MKKSLAQRVRDAASALDRFTANDLMEPLEIKRYSDILKIRSCIRDLRKQGEVESLDRGVYRFVGNADTGMPGVLSRIYRAMYTTGRFSARTIVIVTDADVSYVRLVIRRLLKSGEIRKAGFDKNPRGKKESLFAVLHRDRFYLEYVKCLEYVK